jgi:hypothetical protein
MGDPDRPSLVEALEGVAVMIEVNDPHFELYQQCSRHERPD